MLFDDVRALHAFQCRCHSRFLASRDTCKLPFFHRLRECAEIPLCWGRHGRAIMKPLLVDSSASATPPDLDAAAFLAFLPHVVLAEEPCRLRSHDHDVCAMPIDSRSECDLVIKEWFSFANRHDTFLSASIATKCIVKHDQ